MTNNIDAIESKFFAALGNGGNATIHLNDMIQSVVKGRDTTIITKAIARAEKKGDTAAANIVRFVTRQVFPEAKVGKTKKGGLSIKISGVQANPDALARLADAAERKLSIRNQTFRRVIQGESEKAKKDFDVDAWAKRQAKAHPDQIASMIAALTKMQREQSVSH